MRGEHMTRWRLRLPKFICPGCWPKTGSSLANWIVSRSPQLQEQAPARRCRRMVGQMQRLLRVARTAATDKSFADIQPPIARLEKESLNRNFYDRLRFPRENSAMSLARVVNRGMRAETERSMVICAVALKRYSVRHG